jgi:ubiquinone/menaquinone biosynthesis C-methylase UbiE
MARRLCYPPGLIYDGILEPLLDGVRKKVRDVIIKNDLFPVLDLCCGPGAQVRRLAGRGRFSCGLDINLRMLKYAARRREDIPFVCADAARTPFRTAAFKAVVVSFALHEKPAEMRSRLLAEAKRLLLPAGRIVLVDFENPWDRPSRLAYLYVWLIERLAGNDHFRNGRDFFAKGGLRALLGESHFREVERHDIPAGTCAVVVAAPR